MLCDILIIIFMILSLFFGWRKGFVRSVYSILSLVICIAATYFLRDTIAEVLASTPWGESLGASITDSYAGFIAEECTSAIFTVVSAVVIYFAAKLVLQFVLKIMDFLTSLPVIRGFNQILGLVVNGIVGFVWIVILVNLCSMLPQTQEAVMASRIVAELGIILV